MKHRRKWIRGIAAACAMLVMILDTRTAVISARDGVLLCLNTVIPSLFPFIVLSTALLNNLRCCQQLSAGTEFPVFTAIGAAM